MPETSAILERLLIALLIGFLIGLERERAEMRKARPLFAGVRTFPLIALVGAVAVLLVDPIGPWLPIVSFLAIAAVTLISYFRSARAGEIGATTEIAAIGTFLLGALAGTGRLLTAAAAGVTVAILLAAKVHLERFSRALREDEILAALELAVISSIVLPLLPNRGFGPWGALNPFQIWLVVVLVSSLSFAGFVAARIFGKSRGLVLAAAFGGLVSSTFVTVSMASRARGNRSLSVPAAAATVLASVILCPRVLILVAAMGPGAVPRVLPVIVAMAATGAVASWILIRQVSETPDKGREEISSPLHLRAALGFGAVYAVMVLAVRAAQLYLGSIGMLATAAIAGFVDVDAVTIALARTGPGDDGWRAIAAGIAVAMVTNTLVKLGIAVTIGQGRFGRDVAIALGLMAAAGGAAATWTWIAYPR